ncbi:hypothetical protein [Methylobacterium iners]|uniref:Uncharacterized protein n=1 Tax=Methylobacterium iners TaxID=418707 RepID=A0ABQ4S5H2_9HYPH|nr:hypothetical protein [Methylobacterium iners]GJD97738.1 hypothetical protein OCOJLMKI_4971 [Methylobacterium iners]
MTAPDNEDRPLLDRMGELLAAILDEPLMTLPGSGPEGSHPLELRLSHFRPEFSERAAILLEEAGL